MINDLSSSRCMVSVEDSINFSMDNITARKLNNYLNNKKMNPIRCKTVVNGLIFILITVLQN